MSAGIESDRAQQDITRVVRDSTSNAVDGLIIRVDDSSIHIGGNAGSYYVKQLATQAALGICHGRSVQNEISVS